jgi:hypothetical protein
MPQWILVTEDFYILTMLALKMSLGTFFLRILVRTWERRIIYIIVTVSTLYGIGLFFFAVFQCGIFENAFDFWSKLTSHRCITPPQVKTVTYTYAIITIATDFAFALLPVKTLWESAMQMKEKLIVGFILLLGTMYVVNSTLHDVC